MNQMTKCHVKDLTCTELPPALQSYIALQRSSLLWFAGRKHFVVSMMGRLLNYFFKSQKTLE